MIERKVVSGLYEFSIQLQHPIGGRDISTGDRRISSQSDSEEIPNARRVLCMNASREAPIAPRTIQIAPTIRGGVTIDDGACAIATHESPASGAGDADERSRIQAGADAANASFGVRGERGERGACVRVVRNVVVLYVGEQPAARAFVAVRFARVSVFAMDDRPAIPVARPGLNHRFASHRRSS